MNDIVEQPKAASQSTIIEQSRVIAEVQGALTVAQGAPRIAAVAAEAIMEVCKVHDFAAHAFFTYPRGGEQVSGPTIHFATELARCWGNIDYGIKELNRTSTRSEMLAFAWDLQSNTRVETTFIVPHGRDTRRGFKPFADMRDIYDNNANMGARRLREQILRVIPRWLVESAKRECRATLDHGGGVSLDERKLNVIKSFDKGGITKAQLERKQGRKIDEWSSLDVTNLEILFESLKNGEITKEEAFKHIRTPIDQSKALDAGELSDKPIDSTVDDKTMTSERAMELIKTVTEVKTKEEYMTIGAEILNEIEKLPESPLKKSVQEAIANKAETFKESETDE